MELAAISLLPPATGEAQSAISEPLPAIDAGRHPPCLSWFSSRSFEPAGFLFAPLHTRVWRDEALVKLLEEALAFHSSIQGRGFFLRQGSELLKRTNSLFLYIA